MKALTIRDPWATLIAIGAKRLETRSWTTAYRGQVAIHSSLAFTKTERSMCLVSPFYEALGLWLFRTGELGMARGSVIAIADLVDVSRIERVGRRSERPVDCDYRTGRHPHDPMDIVTVGTEPLTDKNELTFGLYCHGRYAWRFENVRRIVPQAVKGQLALWNWNPVGWEYP